MDYLNEEGYKKILSDYITCFSSLFPEVQCSWEADGFCINGQNWTFRDITGADCSVNYLILEIKERYRIYLPTFLDANYHIEPIGDELLN